MLALCTLWLCKPGRFPWRLPEACAVYPEGCQNWSRGVVKTQLLLHVRGTGWGVFAVHRFVSPSTTRLLHPFFLECKRKLPLPVSIRAVCDLRWGYYWLEMQKDREALVKFLDDRCMLMPWKRSFCFEIREDLCCPWPHTGWVTGWAAVMVLFLR